MQGLGGGVSQIWCTSLKLGLKEDLRNKEKDSFQFSWPQLRVQKNDKEVSHIAVVYVVVPIQNKMGAIALLLCNKRPPINHNYDDKCKALFTWAERKLDTAL